MYFYVHRCTSREIINSECAIEVTGSEVSKHGGKGKASDYMLYLMTFSGGGGGGGGEKGFAQSCFRAYFSKRGR